MVTSLVMFLNAFKSHHPQHSCFTTLNRFNAHFSGALSGLPNVAELLALTCYPTLLQMQILVYSVFLGEYRACCLMSKNWALREAAGQDTLCGEGYGAIEDMAHLCIALGIQDKGDNVDCLGAHEDVIQKFSCQTSNR